LPGDGPVGNALAGQGLDGQTYLQGGGHRYAAPASGKGSSVDNHPEVRKSGCRLRGRLAWRSTGVAGPANSMRYGLI
jgi:hypothetical protein